MEAQNMNFLRQIKIFLWEITKLTVISLLIVGPIRYFVIQPFFVRGASMEPNFYDRDYLIVDEISYRFSEPKRGDVIVLKYPQDASQYFIKRIIGLPGERVKIEGGIVKVFNRNQPEGFVLDESAYLNGRITRGDLDASLGSDDYFVLGDNRDFSLDSRRFGKLSGSYIVGRAWLRAWPINKAQAFETPTY